MHFLFRFSTRHDVCLSDLIRSMISHVFARSGQGCRCSVYHAMPRKQACTRHIIRNRCFETSLISRYIYSISPFLRHLFSEPKCECKVCMAYSVLAKLQPHARFGRMTAVDSSGSGQQDLCPSRLLQVDDWSRDAVALWSDI